MYNAWAFKDVASFRNKYLNGLHMPPKWIVLVNIWSIVNSWYCKPQKWRKWVNFLVIKHFCRFAFSIIKSDPFLLFPCFAAEKNGNCKISNLMLASMPFEFYYIFTKAYLEFFYWKRGYCAYITSLTVTIFFKKRVCMCVRVCMFMYECALSVSSSLCNWCYGTLTKRAKEKILLPFATVGIRYRGVLWMRWYMCIYLDVYMNVETDECSMFSVSFSLWKCDFYHCNADILLLCSHQCELRWFWFDEISNNQNN